MDRHLVIDIHMERDGKQHIEPVSLDALKKLSLRHVFLNINRGKTHGEMSAAKYTCSWRCTTDETTGSHTVSSPIKDYRNSYLCPHCGNEWDVVWQSGVIDPCQFCGENVTPYLTRLIGEYK